MLKIGFNFLIEFFRGIVKEIIADVTEKASLWVDKKDLTDKPYFYTSDFIKGDAMHFNK